MHIKILKYLKDNDNGHYIELNDLPISSDILLSKLKELEKEGKLSIEPSELRVVNGDIISAHDKSSRIRAKILLSGIEYLNSINIDKTPIKNISKEKKLKHISDLITEIRSWTIFERKKVENFIERAQNIISYIDGISSPFISQIDIFRGENSAHKSIIDDWDEKMLMILDKLKNKIDFEEPEIEDLKHDLVIYVSQKRIDELRNIQNDNFDLIKLVQLCKELNDAYKLENYYTVGILVRTIINHVPPIFGKENFISVVNQYKSEGNHVSFKGNMEHLENTSRKIGDSFAHSITRKKENLPNAVQVDFRQGLDVLLGEIVRLLK